MTDVVIYWFDASVRQAKPRFKWGASTGEGQALASILIEPCGLIYPETQAIGYGLYIPSLAEVEEMESEFNLLRPENQDNEFRFDIDKCTTKVSRILKMAHEVYPAERELRKAIEFAEGLKRIAEDKFFKSTTLQVIGIEEARKWHDRIDRLESKIQCCKSLFLDEERSGFIHRRMEIEKIFEAGRRSGEASARRKMREQNKKKKLNLARPGDGDAPLKPEGSPVGP